MNGSRNGNGRGPGRSVQRSERPVLITGGAGFIGTNLAHRLLSSGRTVLLYDNPSRAGVEENLRWLRRCVERASQVFHFAAQLAVTTSLVSPVDDFEINVRGTLNLLEAVREQANPPPLVFTSTNKVYGGFADVPLRKNSSRYEPTESAIRQRGICEQRPLDFHSPYGCSKGSADQYVLDYARTYGLPTIVFRMSCIYGPHQFGNEDQGWVAHFLIRAIEGKPITLYGDSVQVRDILFVEDLVNAFLLAQQRMASLAGEAFNIGGGPTNTISLLELVRLIGELHGAPPRLKFAEWRPGDQRYYVSDIRKFQAATGWAPRVGVREGVTRLYGWLRESRGVAKMKAGERATQPMPMASSVAR